MTQIRFCYLVESLLCSFSKLIYALWPERKGKFCIRVKTITMDFILRFYTRLSCTIIKWNSQRAKFTLSPFCAKQEIKGNTLIITYLLLLCVLICSTISFPVSKLINIRLIRTGSQPYWAGYLNHFNGAPNRVAPNFSRHFVKCCALICGKLANPDLAHHWHDLKIQLWTYEKIQCKGKSYRSSAVVIMILRYR